MIRIWFVLLTVITWISASENSTTVVPGEYGTGDNIINRESRRYSKDAESNELKPRVLFAPNHQQFFRFPKAAVVLPLQTTARQNATFGQTLGYTTMLSGGLMVLASLLGISGAASLLVGKRSIPDEEDPLAGITIPGFNDDSIDGENRCKDNLLKCIVDAAAPQRPGEELIHPELAKISGLIREKLGEAKISGVSMLNELAEQVKKRLSSVELTGPAGLKENLNSREMQGMK